MAAINSVINLIFRVAFAPFNSMPPIVGLIVISVIAGVVLLYVFKLTSNQDAIAAVKDRIKGGFLEIKLFQDDPGIVAGAFGRILWSNFVYLRYSMVPVLFMLVPVVLILVQCDMRYGVRPLKADESAVFIVHLNKGAEASLDNIRLEVPDGLEIVVDAVRIATELEASWKVKVLKEGNYDLKVKVDETELSFPVKALPTRGPVSKIAAAGFVDLVENPGLAPLANGQPVAKMELKYPGAEFNILGKNIHWLIVFLVVSLIFGYSVKGVFGVEV